MNEVATIDTTTSLQWLRLWVWQADAPKHSKASTLHGCVSHTPHHGSQEIGGKKKNVEVISGGAYKLEIPDGPTYYAESWLSAPSYNALCTRSSSRVMSNTLTVTSRL